ncbi:maleate cis-trans isomerase [Alphaproteobacteria bacterium]|nr:maleate cis-trans isomerase [Alphaproteobacteria bacterium]
MYGWRARLGRINPSPETVGDEEWRRLCPDGTMVVSTRMFIEAVDRNGLTNMVKNVERAARELATTRANVILMAGTAGAFNGGPGFDQELVKRIEDASGVPGTTTMTAMLAALDALDVEKIAVATSYIKSVDNDLAEVLRASGRDVVAIRGMGILKSIDMGNVSPETTYRFAYDMLAEANGADACLLSCGNWRTLESVEPLEASFGIPVLTSNQTGLWQALRMSGVATQSVTGGGHLFALPGPAKIVATTA